MMRNGLIALLFGTMLCANSVTAQERLVTGKVTRDENVPLSGVSVVVKGTTQTVQTNNAGDYSIRVNPGQVLLFRLIGYLPRERQVGAEGSVNVTLEKAAANLDALVVTALGQTTTQRSLGASQQTVTGADVAQTGRENFINGLQGRVAGIEVTSTSGMPGASSSITIRGVSSISGSNQPLMVIDGLPMDNKTLNTNVLASDVGGVAQSNRGVDFNNRAADINPEDIESMVVLKGPEAAALYGIDAANGAIVITTKRGKPGVGGLEYSNRFRVDQTRGNPETQRVYGPTSVAAGGIGSFSYYGAPYAADTRFYDNIDGFFQTAVSQQHNVTFSGASPDSRVNYRVGLSANSQGSVVRTADYTRLNLTGSTGATITSWLKTDLSMNYAQVDNSKTLGGANGPLLGLLVWPSTDDAKDYLSAAGTRRRVTLQAAATELDNPYFSLEKNRFTEKNGRLIANLGLVLSPFSWGYLRTNLGSDSFTNENLILRHPESALGISQNGILETFTDVTRNLNAQTIFNVNSFAITDGLSISGLVGNQIRADRSQVTSQLGRDFLDLNFISGNNTNVRTTRTILQERRLIGLYAQATANYRDYLYVTVSGRNDWTSTIPRERNSFFYPSYSTAFIFSDAFPSIRKFMTGKIRGTYAEVGKDARPYAYAAALEFKTTSNGGYGYGFTGPNPNLSPEFATSRELGTELGFFDNRLGLDVTVYRKQTRNAILNDVRGSYGTGFILLNLNGGVTRNEGLEATLRGTPILKRNFTWDVVTNFEAAHGRVVKLPNELPESYVSDTWLAGNVRNGTRAGMSTRSLNGLFYLRNNQGQLLIDPTSGLPLRSPDWIDGGYDRQPDFTIGLTNTFRYKKFSVSALLDLRKGGDVYNATERFLTAAGLTNRTLDRERPRVIDGVLRDGKENSATPTANTITVIPAIQTGYYTTISEELFIEKDINWVRLRDVTLRMVLPGKLVRGRDASVFLTGTDLFLFTNYSGLDPIVNGNTAAVGGSGGAGIDLGNFPMPRGVAFGFKVGY
ncbi:MAG TPA: SusC/RagA family TonB-linked outer membrane protein [Gemmatimonas sp.]|nr:SusC/RagA family TonB-linked outer membrane protein [Gemmatimonas sp.]